MEVHHKGKEKRTSIFPCERDRTVLEYKREKKDCIYSCWSNMVVLTFVLTIRVAAPLAPTMHWKEAERGNFFVATAVDVQTSRQSTCNHVLPAINVF